MKIFLFLSLLLFQLGTYSQQSYRALYNIEFMIDTSYINKEHKKNKSSSLLKERVRNKIKNQFYFVLKLSRHIDFYLEFNQTDSRFYLPQQIETKEFKIFKRFSRFKGQYYSFKNSTLHEMNAFGQNFLINLPATKWKLTQTSKIIGKYKCYKAITQKLIGTKFYDVYAWFTPDLPFNFGPMGYQGLPGLILKLETGNLSYNLKELIKIKSMEIKKPSKGQNITLDDFNLMAKKVYKKRKKEFN